MADQNGPNPNANKDKAEGERWTAGQSGNRSSTRDEHPERNYPNRDRGDASGITNRPLSEEVENQEHLPDRGTYKDETDNPASTRREGDYDEDQR